MQIPDAIRKCVVFVCYKNGKGIKPAGTAFFVGMPLEATQRWDIYLITAKHVIEGIREHSIDQKVYLRINLKVGKSMFLETQIENWIFHTKESNVDVAVLRWTPLEDTFDYRYFPLNMAATEEVIKKEDIGVGDDVFLTGLFVNHVGSQRNLPIIRVGNIASMPEEKVHTEKLGDIDAYLVEARSIGGLSGAPVFTYLGTMRSKGLKMLMGRQGPLFYWLGLMHGHFDLSELALDESTEDTLVNLSINMGIAIVVPVWKIIEVLNQDTFIKARDELKKVLEKKLPTTDTADSNSKKEIL